MTLANDQAPRREFGLTRVFDAPRDLVFKVWTDPRYVALWWGVEGATTTRCELDVRPGGAWRIDMRTASGVVYPNAGVFLEVIENERLVYSDIPDPASPAWAGSPPAPYVHSVSFEDDEGGGTRVSLSVRTHSAADCERLLKTGMREGIGQGLDRLERLLRELRADSDRAPAKDRMR
jgi:uncharacterized protein YndB with AHSA1/START domain